VFALEFASRAAAGETSERIPFPTTSAPAAPEPAGTPLEPPADPAAPGLGGISETGSGGAKLLARGAAVPAGGAPVAVLRIDGAPGYWAKATLAVPHDNNTPAAHAIRQTLPIAATLVCLHYVEGSRSATVRSYTAETDPVLRDRELQFEGPGEFLVPARPG